MNWDEDQIDRTLKAHTEMELNAIPKPFWDAADLFSVNAEQYDDMTVVAIRIT